MHSVAYYNGVISTPEKIRIPLSDRAIFFGDGVYDAAIGKNGRIYEAKDHIDRFFDNLNNLKIKPYCSKERLVSILDDLIKDFDTTFFLYFQSSRSYPERIHSALHSDTNLLITVKEIQLDPPSKRLKLLTHKDLRYLYCNVKSLNLLPAVIASTKAEAKNCDETVFHRDGTITECAHSNIFIYKNETLITAPKSNWILPGITRAHLIKTAADLGMHIEERYFDLNELFSADEIFVTSTSKFCKTVESIDGITVGGRRRDVATALCNALYNDFLMF